MSAMSATSVTARRLPCRTLLLALLTSLLLPTFALSIQQPTNGAHHNKQYRFAVLLAGDHRTPRIDGFKQEMARHGDQYGVHHVYTFFNAEGNSSQLLPLARQIVASHPDVAIAAGGIEADALKLATDEAPLPVVFLFSASCVERGQIESIRHPGGNLTGIDSNDTVLTEKRLWYLHKMLPGIKHVTCFSIPTIGSSAESAVLAVEAGKKLGLEVRIIDLESKDELKSKAQQLVRRDNTDAILLFPCGPIHQVFGEALAPLATELGIPIFGDFDDSLAKGAFAHYGSLQSADGAQAARLAIKILHGASPADIPVEIPQHYELVLNRSMIERLKLNLPPQIWRLADRIVDAAPAF
ncbi:ABC transporter substrate-binding protein [Desulfuromonas thiophila]|uniref:Putative ABC transport system substrate-binding protein n=1 Tax=Desulfuromonas thiophila TaxID=57664 RepID=A0A1G7ADY4_9BACT|nr:ABC transporter substrate-binding protein [Desulfuromonas thiophila]SDE13134.1 putative ABC transport system substrate-binding protein [Desulfuromonas thiophila]